METLAAHGKEQAAGFQLQVDRPVGGSWTCLLGNEAITVGRAEDNRIVLDERLVSRHHARIERDGDCYKLTDLGSKNGTLVNGRPARERTLSPGDLIEIGDSKITYTVPPPALVPPAPPSRPHAHAQPRALGPLETDATVLGALAEACTRMAAGEVDLAVLDSFSEEVRLVVPSERVIVVLLEEKTGRPLMQFAFPTESPEPGEEILRVAASTREPRCLRAPKPGAPIDSRLGISRHVIIVPLEASDRRLGLLLLDRAASAEPYSDESLYLATLLGAQLTSFLRLVVAYSAR